MKKRIWIPLAAIAIMLFAAFSFVTDGLSEAVNVSIQGVDLSAVPDGSYTGTYEFKRWTCKLTVHVQNHTIEAIDMDNDVAASDITDCSGEMIRRVIEAQNTTVDAVSGATATSKAYLKAIEDALK